MKEYENIIDYVKRNFNSFEEEKINEVDSVVFSTLAYLRIHEEFSNNFSKEGMPITNLFMAEYFKEMFSQGWGLEDAYLLLAAVVSSPRYRNIRIKYYRNEFDPNINLQFSAVVFSVSEKCHYVAYRGTDGTVIGWKEDFLMALNNPVAAQKMGLNYLESVGEVLEGELIVGGHSKGGNLAVFSSVHCKEAIRKRISAVYSHDGPGFLKMNVEEPSFMEMKEKIHKTIPTQSFFGLLFECETDVKKVESSEKGVKQHNTFTWKVKNSEFVEGIDNAKSSTKIKKMNTWINSMDNSQRITFLKGMFNVVDQLGVEMIGEFKNKMRYYIPKIISAIKGLEAEERKFLMHALRMLLFGGKNNKMEVSMEGLPEILNVGKSELEEFSEEYSLYIKKLASEEN